MNRLHTAAHAMAAAMTALEVRKDDMSIAFKRLDFAIDNSDLVGAINNPPTKDKRSSRRCAARMRASGHHHVDGDGWV